MTPTYAQKDDRLRIEDPATGALIWEGQPDGCSVLKVAALPNSDDALILLDWMAAPARDGNLRRYSPELRLIWKAVAPQSSHDCYVSFRLEDAVLIADSWSGYKVVIDQATGSILERAFTK